MLIRDKKVILASSLGTIFEWYDFYLYGSLASVIAKHFFSHINPSTGFIFALLGFAAGFILRPFGGAFFGRLGDLFGRKYTFILTIILMGGATFSIGLLPNYHSIGIAAPVLLIVLRLIQGLAIGGEYGGAAIYVAEHAPIKQRGAYTSWIQTTATFGLFLSLLVILFTREFTGQAFNEWGWRIPFLGSGFLLLFSVLLRASLHESPVFEELKRRNALSEHPLRESFLNLPNFKMIVIVLFGVIAGQAVVFYTSQFYELYFLTQILHIDEKIANQLLAGAILLSAPFAVLFGTLSDKIGRKPIIMTGLLLAAVLYIPIFKGIAYFANPALVLAQEKTPIKIIADLSECSLNFNPLNIEKPLTSCDIAKQALSQQTISYEINAGLAGQRAQIQIGVHLLPTYSAAKMTHEERIEQEWALKKMLRETLKTAGYPHKADSTKINYLGVFALLSLTMIFVMMIYGPLAALLVDLFPAKIRYTSISIPYHIGNGWFGGLLPAITFSLSDYKGDIYYGLWYPVIICSISFIIGMIFIKENKQAIP
jgi:MFS family permease